MNAKKILVLGLLFLFCSGWSTANAFGMKPESGRPQPKRMMGKLVKQLNLTKEQQENFLAQEKLIQEKDLQIRKANAKIMDKIQQEIKKDQPDLKIIKKYIDQVQQNQSLVHLSRIENMIQFRKQLSAEQKKKFDEMKPKHEPKRESKRKQK
jgi:Spy/CpxP family protein refolding chaperone